jgi:hypothetical protein
MLLILLWILPSLLRRREKNQKKKVEKWTEEDEEEEFDFENQTDSEEEETGLVKWCAESEFLRGKPMSVDTLQELKGLVKQNQSPDHVPMPITNLPKQRKRKNSAAPLPQLAAKEAVLFHLHL